MADATGDPADGTCCLSRAARHQRRRRQARREESGGANRCAERQAQGQQRQRTCQTYEGTHKVPLGMAEGYTMVVIPSGQQPHVYGKSPKNNGLLKYVEICLMDYTLW